MYIYRIHHISVSIVYGRFSIFPPRYCRLWNWRTISSRRRHTLYSRCPTPTKGIRVYPISIPPPTLVLTPSDETLELARLTPNPLLVCIVYTYTCIYMYVYRIHHISVSIVHGRFSISPPRYCRLWNWRAISSRRRHTLYSRCPTPTKRIRVSPISIPPAFLRS